MKNVSKRLLMTTATMSLAAFFYSCGSDEPLPFRVFVGGEDILDTINTTLVLPTVWVNGEAMQLEGGGQDNSHKYVRDVAFKNNHCYATGYENSNTGWKAKVWKDDNLIYTFNDANHSSIGEAVAVSKGDVYVAGTKISHVNDQSFAILIKNSQVTTLSGASSSGQAFAVAVSGNDVYVGGVENNEARLWKNGASLPLNNGAGYQIHSIVVVGVDVYAMGQCNCWEGARIRYWKNGVSNDFTTANEIAFGYDMAVSGADVYVVGVDNVSQTWRARIWKNGIGTTLTPDGINGWARGIALDGSTVYVVGEQRTSNDIFNHAMLWTDNAPAVLGTRRSRAFGVAISKEN